MFEVTVVLEAAYDFALWGLGLSRGKTSRLTPNEFVNNEGLYEQLAGVAIRKAKLDNGENKFLEHIYVGLNVNAPREWWAQMDTYRVGISKQSESSDYTLMKTELTQQHFDGGIDSELLYKLNIHIQAGDEQWVRRNMPWSFLQRRGIATNYKSLRHVYAQRHNDRFANWRYFCNELLAQLDHPEFISDF